MSQRKIPSPRHALVLGVALVASAAGCVGQVGQDGPGSGGDVDSARRAKQPKSSPEKLDPAPSLPPGEESSKPPAPGGPDPGRIGLHRLNNAEYDATARDLLGVSATQALTSFIPDEKAAGFDRIAAALGVTDAQYEQYYDAAEALAEQTFAKPALKARILTCAPASATDTACTRSIVETFGLRAWRRPLATSEIDRLVAVAASAAALGESFEGSIREVVKVMLASPPFLFRIEPDPEPRSTTAERVEPYAMASRLSYLVWGSMPDEALFRAAASGELAKDEVIGKELERLLASPRASAFVTSFAGQWLGLRDMATHQIEVTAFPDWHESLRDPMVNEGFRYFREFFDQGLDVRNFFTHDVNFVSDRLAKLYGITPAASGSRVVNTTDQRVGFLGLGAFLTNSSFSYRTSPTLRGQWVLENLLCEHLPPPPASVPELDGGDGQTAEAISQNVRARLEQHRRDPSCAGCHDVLDPIGLGLEAFDGIGRHRTTYPNGDAVSSAGRLPDGTTFEGLRELAPILARDTRFTDCVAERLMTYVLARELSPSDRPYLDGVRQRWLQKGAKLRTLLTEIVMSDPFRFRRGDAVN